MVILCYPSDKIRDKMIRFHALHDSLRYTVDVTTSAVTTRSDKMELFI